MKTYKELVEELDLSGVQNIDSAIVYFNEKMGQFFDKSTYKWIAHFDDTLGESINIAFSQKGWKVSALETPTYMMFMIPINKGQSEYVVQKIVMDEELEKGNVTFKGIKAKTPLEAVEKMINWFKRNKEKIDAIKGN